MSTNYSFYSIPAYWILSLYPHIYAIGVIKKANNNKWNNANPRGTDTDERYKKAVPAEAFTTYERAEAAHKNGMENAPFFIGAVLAGNYAGLSPSTLNAITGTYLGLRVLYTVLYVKISSQKASYLRTLTWFSTLVLLVGTYVKAAHALSSK